MSFELLFDPLFRVPFATGLLLAAILPLIGMYLRLRNEWLAALAFAQMASAGALVAMVLDGPMLAGGVLAALLAALVKGLLARAGASAYALMMLLAWGGGVLLVANHPLAEQAGHALFDGQLYFTGEAHLLVTALAAVVVLPVLAWLSRPLLLARFFPEFYRARGQNERPRLLLFDLLAGLVAALVYSFVRAITTVSAVIFLVTAENELATTYIIGRVGNGDYGVALAYCTVLILLMSASTGLIQWLVGDRKLGRRGSTP